MVFKSLPFLCVLWSWLLHQHWPLTVSERSLSRCWCVILRISYHQISLTTRNVGLMSLAISLADHRKVPWRSNVTGKTDVLLDSMLNRGKDMERRENVKDRQYAINGKPAGFWRTALSACHFTVEWQRPSRDRLGTHNQCCHVGAIK